MNLLFLCLIVGSNEPRCRLYGQTEANGFSVMQASTSMCGFGLAQTLSERVDLLEVIVPDLDVAA
jgi:hypothetical protein